MCSVIFSVAACLALPYFSTLSQCWFDCRGKSYWTQNMCLIFSKTVVWNIFRSKKNSARCYHRCVNHSSYLQDFKETLIFSTISSDLFVSFRPSIRPRWTTLLPLDRSSWNFKFDDFFKICRQNWSFTKSANINWNLLEDLYAFVIISRWFLLRMRNFSNKSCTEDQNTHFIFNNLIP